MFERWEEETGRGKKRTARKVENQKIVTEASRDESLIRERMEVLNVKLVRSDGKTPES